MIASCDLQNACIECGAEQWTTLYKRVDGFTFPPTHEQCEQCGEVRPLHNEYDGDGL